MQTERRPTVSVRLSRYSADGVAREGGAVSVPARGRRRRNAVGTQRGKKHRPASSWEGKSPAGPKKGTSHMSHRPNSAHPQVCTACGADAQQAGDPVTLVSLPAEIHRKIEAAGPQAGLAIWREHRANGGPQTERTLCRQ